MNCHPAAQPLLPNSNQPRQNWADSGTPKIQVNPTQVLGQMNHPFLVNLRFCHDHETQSPIKSRLRFRNLVLVSNMRCCVAELKSCSIPPWSLASTCGHSSQSQAIHTRNRLTYTYMTSTQRGRGGQKMPKFCR